MVVVFAFGFPVCGLVESRNLAFVLMYAKMYEHLSCNLKSCLMDFTFKVCNDHQHCDSGILSIKDTISYQDLCCLSLQSHG